MDEITASPDDDAAAETRRRLAKAWGPDWDQAAMAMPCEFEGCSGVGHDNSPNPAEWRHEVVSETFDDGIVQADISAFTNGDPVLGAIHFAGDGEMTAAEFRAAADKYEAFPAWLRSLADRMDALSA
ncbi:hypothetical protein E3O19_01450 [Cryobacterium algoritolerans]|uniref:Uncharacterized protein n=1 Tax=Cryobacterium algoritolerans TaxID=1259184 RepID=A0A4R8WX11_9MICO|nr:hypothetical protein [Cryobacterium algoritolerans]TFC20064.1 hypothetical protein E3O19_01450 [Cryobacterium algoritolerans]